MFEQFDDAARRSVVFAQQECRRLGHSKIDAAHLAIGILQVPGCALAQAAVVTSVLRAAMVEGTPDPADGGHIPFTPSAKQALERSLRIALVDGRQGIDRYDLLLAAMEAPEVAEPLAAALDLDDLRAAVAAARGGPTTTPNGDALVVALLREVLARLEAIESRLERLEP